MKTTSRTNLPTSLRRSALVACLSLAACGSNPPAPDWQLIAKSGVDRAVAAWFVGDARGEVLAFEEARQAIQRTGQPALLARAELVRCAAHVAALVVEECAGFTALAADAAPAERAYAMYLTGKATAADVPLLPPHHQAIATAGLASAAAAPATSSADVPALASMPEPLSKLIGAAVLLQTGRGSPAVVGLAVDTASAQGWRRPLRAWLQVQSRQAAAAGDSEAVNRIRRRIELVERPTRPLAPDPAASTGLPAP